QGISANRPRAGRGAPGWSAVCWAGIRRPGLDSVPQLRECWPWSLPRPPGVTARGDRRIGQKGWSGPKVQRQNAGLPSWQRVRGSRGGIRQLWRVGVHDHLEGTEKEGRWLSQATAKDETTGLEQDWATPSAQAAVACSARAEGRSTMA